MYTIIFLCMHVCVCICMYDCPNFNVFTHRHNHCCFSHMFVVVCFFFVFWIFWKFNALAHLTTASALNLCRKEWSKLEIYAYRFVHTHTHTYIHMYIHTINVNFAMSVNLSAFYMLIFICFCCIFAAFDFPLLILTFILVLFLA